MSRKDALRIPDYLGHILEAIERIHRYVDDISEVQFLDVVWHILQHCRKHLGDVGG